MSRAATLIEEISALIRQLGASEDGDAELGERVTELLTRARLVAKSAAPSELRPLQASLDALAAAIAARMEGIERALREVGTRRSALSAYGALRTHHSAQNLRTRA